MNLSSVHKVYFIGIGGIGMSALARFFHANGKKVAGYDKTETPLTHKLEESGIQIHFSDDINLISEPFLDPSDTLVVFTPAIPHHHSELQYFLNHSFSVLKRAEVLGLITKNSFCFAVAGTHGKTTSSTILGHILASKNATAFLGGISENYKSNLILGGDEISVVEADEFDRSFLQLFPNTACITSIDADHLDIYGEAKELENSFRDFASLVEGKFFVANGIPISGITYGLEDDSDFSAQNIRVEKGSYVFDIKTPKDGIKDVWFSLPGRHNVMNAMAAVSMAYSHGVSLEKIKECLKSFKGVERRFSYKIKSDEFVLIDDYAHHPTEISAVGQSVKEMYENNHSLVVFQPHLFSRTRDFMDDFARSLELFDEVLLLDIYPARELPIEGVTSQELLNRVQKKRKKLVAKNQLFEEIQQSSATVVAMLGAGDIGLEVDRVCEQIKKKQTHEA